MKRRSEENDGGRVWVDGEIAVPECVAAKEVAAMRVPAATATEPSDEALSDADGRVEDPFITQFSSGRFPPLEFGRVACWAGATGTAGTAIHPTRRELETPNADDWFVVVAVGACEDDGVGRLGLPLLDLPSDGAIAGAVLWTKSGTCGS
jgi:hypothetical protein